MNLRHPVLLSLIATLILVAAGLYFVERQRAVSPTGGGASWATDRGFVENAVQSAPENVQPPLPDTTSESGPETLVIPHAKATTTAKTAIPKGDDTFDFNEMLARLEHKQDTAPAAQAHSTYEQLTNAFSFSLQRPAVLTPKTRSAEQEALYVYGNEIGRRVQGFAAVNPNMPQHRSCYHDVWPG